MNDKEKERPHIPPVKEEAGSGEYTPFNYSGRNLYKSPYWYSVFVSVFLLLYTPEFVGWFKTFFPENFNSKTQSNLFILALMGFWLACVVLPNSVVWLYLNYKEKNKTRVRTL